MSASECFNEFVDSSQRIKRFRETRPYIETEELLRALSGIKAEIQRQTELLEELCSLNNSK